MTRRGGENERRVNGLGMRADVTRIRLLHLLQNGLDLSAKGV
ncbi:hypothetical protein ACFPRL_26155 [Pseudoclavibacter helvolus]